MDNRSNGKATASLVLGIISLVFIFFGTYAFIGMVLAIIGLVLGIQAKKESPDDGKAKAGVILSIIGLSLCALSFIACIACVGALAGLSL
ncbi:MAG: hypothetical protein GX306_11495 [Clostridiales bacterium]|nr:hypothetical protein [Clostridiales bacterium]